MEVSEIIKTIHGNIEIAITDVLKKNEIALVNKDEISRRMYSERNGNYPHGIQEFYYLDGKCIFVSTLKTVDNMLTHEIAEVVE